MNKQKYLKTKSRKGNYDKKYDENMMKIWWTNLRRMRQSPFILVLKNCKFESNLSIFYYKSLIDSSYGV